MKAERLFKDVMSRLLSKGSAEDDNKMVGISLKLARIYGEWNQDEKAVVGYKFAIDAQEKKIKNGEWAGDLGGYSGHHQRYVSALRRVLSVY